MTNYTPVRSKEQFYAATGLENMKAMLDDLGWTYQPYTYGLNLFTTDTRYAMLDVDDGEYIGGSEVLVASRTTYEVMGETEFRAEFESTPAAAVNIILTGESYAMGGSGEKVSIRQQS
jgi:hypothetical protein